MRQSFVFSFALLMAGGGCYWVPGPDRPCINTCKICRKASFVQDLRQERTTWVQGLSK